MRDMVAVGTATAQLARAATLGAAALVIPCLACGQGVFSNAGTKQRRCMRCGDACCCALALTVVMSTPGSTRLAAPLTLVPSLVYLRAGRGGGGRGGWALVPQTHRKRVEPALALHCPRNTAPALKRGAPTAVACCSNSSTRILPGSTVQAVATPPLPPMPPHAQAPPDGCVAERPSQQVRGHAQQPHTREAQHGHHLRHV